MTDKPTVFVVPKINFDADGNPRLLAPVDWQFNVTGNACTMTQGDFTITVMCGGFDLGFEVLALFSCVMSPDIQTVKLVIDVQGYEWSFNKAIGEVCKLALEPHNWVFTDLTGHEWCM